MPVITSAPPPFQRARRYCVVTLSSQLDLSFYDIDFISNAISPSSMPTFLYNEPLAQALEIAPEAPPVQFAYRLNWHQPDSPRVALDLFYQHRSGVNCHTTASGGVFKVNGGVAYFVDTSVRLPIGYAVLRNGQEVPIFEYMLMGGLGVVIDGDMTGLYPAQIKETRDAVAV